MNTASFFAPIRNVLQTTRDVRAFFFLHFEYFMKLLLPFLLLMFGLELAGTIFNDLWNWTETVTRHISNLLLIFVALPWLRFCLTEEKTELLSFRKGDGRFIILCLALYGMRMAGGYISQLIPDDYQTLKNILAVSVIYTICVSSFILVQFALQQVAFSWREWLSKAAARIPSGVMALCLLALPWAILATIYTYGVGFLFYKIFSIDPRALSTYITYYILYMPISLLLQPIVLALGLCCIAHSYNAVQKTS